eukprot:g1279.t1
MRQFGAKQHRIALIAAIVLPVVMSTQTPPSWPVPIKPVWPTRHVSINYTGHFPLGPPPYDQVSLVGTWYYDWPNNMWRQDTCVKMNPNASATCKIELWAGNDHTAGSSAVGTTYVWDEKGVCAYAPSMVPAITHPDSFAEGEYRERLHLDGKWGDEWIQNTASWIHYNFSTTMDIVTDLEACAARAAKHASEGKYERALIDYRKLLFFRPKDPRTYASVAEIHFALCDVKTAIMYLEKAFRLSPETIAYKQRLAELYDIQGLLDLQGGTDDLNHAIASFEKAIAADFCARYWLHLSLALTKIGDVSKAISAVTRYCKLDPEDVDAIVLKAKLLWKLGDRPSRVLGFHCLQEARRLNPKHPEVKFLEGVIRKAQHSSYDRAIRLMSTGDLRSALEELLSHFSKQMDAKSLLLRAQCRRKLGHLEEALADAKLAETRVQRAGEEKVRVADDEIRNRVERERNLLLNEIGLKKIESSVASEKTAGLEILQRVVRDERERSGRVDSGFLQNLGDANLELGRLKEALRCYDEATAEATKRTSMKSAANSRADLRARLGAVHGAMGVDHFNHGEYHEAIASFNRAIRHDGTVAHFHAHRGCAKFALSNFEGAYNDWKRAVRIDPSNAIATSRLAQYRTEGTSAPSKK